MPSKFSSFSADGASDGVGGGGAVQLAGAVAGAGGLAVKLSVDKSVLPRCSWSEAWSKKSSSWRKRRSHVWQRYANRLR